MMYFTNREIAEHLDEHPRDVASMMRRMYLANELDRRGPPMRPDCTVPYLWRLSTGDAPMVSEPVPWFPKYGNDRRRLATRNARRRGKREEAA
jgi:hypothetical protein